MLKVRIAALLLLIAGGLIGWFVYSSEGVDARFPFHFGLDLSGGTHLVYSADTSQIPAEDVSPSMEALRAVVE